MLPEKSDVTLDKHFSFLDHKWLTCERGKQYILLKVVVRIK